MIVITEHAEQKLEKALEAIRPKPEAYRVLHLPLAEQPALYEKAKAVRPMILESIHRHLPEAGGQTFWCEDGDLFVLAPHINSKNARELLLELAALLKTEANAQFGSLLECQLYLNRLLAMLETKAERKRLRAEEERKRLELAQLQQKRTQILQSPALQTMSPAEIKQRRQERLQPEILIIEDDTFTRKLLDNVLKSRFKLSSLGSAEVALATYQQVLPDVVFLDINLPDVTGHELLQQFIRIDPNAYVVMLSGNADKANILTAMQNGAKGFVAKPFTKEKLFQYIDRCPTIATVKV